MEVVAPVTSMSSLPFYHNIIFTISTYFNEGETTELIVELLQKQIKHPNQVSEIFQTPLLKLLKENLLHILEQICLCSNLDRSFGNFFPSVYICKITGSCFSFPNGDRTNLKVIFFRISSSLAPSEDMCHFILIYLFYSFPS